MYASERLGNQNTLMPLPQFKGYYVDYRLREFRSIVPYPEVIEFVDFDSEKGQELLMEMMLQEK
jgi:hypothetical protein